MIHLAPAKPAARSIHREEGMLQAAVSIASRPHL